MTKECLECRKNINGRSDKKFCSDACRVSFNNRNNSAKSGFVRIINTILVKNRNILEECALAALPEISKIKLLQKGFNFHFYTNKNRSKKGEMFFYCYEYGYKPTKNNHCILTKQTEMDL